MEDRAVVKQAKQMIERVHSDTSRSLETTLAELNILAEYIGELVEAVEEDIAATTQ